MPSYILQKILLSNMSRLETFGMALLSLLTVTYSHVVSLAVVIWYGPLDCSIPTLNLCRFGQHTATSFMR